MEKIKLQQQLNIHLEKIEKLLRKSSASALHDARKNLKKFRALIRLIRYFIPNEKYVFLNTSARDIARTLATARDFDSAVEACERNYPKLNRYEKNLTTRLKKKIIKYKKQVKIGQEKEINLQILSKIKETVNLIDFTNISDDEVIFAYKKMYRKTKKYLKFLTQDDEIFYFHEWRKNVKYLRYQSAFLKTFWPDYYLWFENQLHILSDVLGNMQDNLLLSEYIKKHLFLKNMAAETYIYRTSKLNKELKINSLNKGELILTETSKSIEKRLKTAVKKYCAE